MSLAVFQNCIYSMMLILNCSLWLVWCTTQATSANTVVSAFRNLSVSHVWHLKSINFFFLCWALSRQSLSTEFILFLLYETFLICMRLPQYCDTCCLCQPTISIFFLLETHVSFFAMLIKSFLRNYVTVTFPSHPIETASCDQAISHPNFSIAIFLYGNYLH